MSGLITKSMQLKFLCVDLLLPTRMSYLNVNRMLGTGGSQKGVHRGFRRTDRKTL